MIGLSKPGNTAKGWLAGGAVMAAGVVAWALLHNPSQDDVVTMAYSVPNGGGYALGDSGTPAPVLFNGIEILGKKKPGTHCCGFTFYVAMKVAQQRGLLKDSQPYDVKRFQKECYGATNASREREIAMAMENLGIGKQIDPLDARPGDFATFQRTPRGPGHSVVFLEYVKHDGTIVGVKFRSSQPTTDGVGDVIEYFASSGYRGATVDSNRFYVCRLNSR